VAIKLKNLTPTMIALMLAPPRDVEPDPEAGRLYTKAEIDALIKNGPQPADPNAKPERKLKPVSVWELPSGVESITPDDTSGVLQVRGTAEGIGRVRQIVEFLDVPLRRVELEVQAVSLNKSDSQGFGVDWTGQGPPMLGVLRRADYRQKVQELVEANRASLLLDARVVAVNNLPSGLSSGTFNGQPQIVPAFEMELVPTINNDNTITVVMQSAVTMPRTREVKAAVENAPPASAKLQTVANVRDGDTIVLGGLGNNETGQITLTFLTARIVRRVRRVGELK